MDGTGTGTLQRTSVDLRGLMQVLGEALYSTPHVAVRELVQNAHDSCERRRLEDAAAPAPRILVEADPAQGILHVEDNGAGLTADEVHRYLATVGTGYTRELRERDPQAGLIGYFGLGFLSAFVVAERTEVWTCSYQAPELAHRFSSRSGESYSLVPAPARPVGSRVSLYLKESFRDLASPSRIAELLRRYCVLLRLPVHLGDGECVNGEPPPWRAPEASALRRKKLDLEFAKRFEGRFEPVATMRLDAGDAVRGLLWIQDGASFATSDQRNVSVFVRGMLISEDERELLPAWAGFMGAVLESDTLKPTASRETLQKDAGYDAAARGVREQLIAGLAELAKSEPAAWRRILMRHNEALLGAALCDPRLFELLAHEVTLPTSEGDLTVSRILERAAGKLYVSQSDERGFEELLFRALKVPVVRGVRFAALPFCKLFSEQRQGTLVLLGTQTGDGSLFRPAQLHADDAARIAIWFGAADRKVVPSRFAPASLPFVLIPNREVLLKRRIESDEADKRIGSALLGLARQATAKLAADAGQTLYVNLDCPAIARLLDAPEDKLKLALGLLRPLEALMAEQSLNADIEGALAAFGEALVTVLGGH
jgi:molecular chaperone HtpG